MGLLHAEMRLAGSLIMACGDAHQVPAGGALAVDRDGFSAAVTAKLEAHPLITVRREEVAVLPPADWEQTIIATGPLTAPALAEAIRPPRPIILMIQAGAAVDDQMAKLRPVLSDNDIVIDAGLDAIVADGANAEDLQAAVLDGLTKSEKDMTVEQWVLYNAKRGEEKLRQACEKQIVAFEAQALRARAAIESLPTY